MENVMAFNNELSGLYDTKPPISKAKMAAITKAAMRAIKFYKHVVQSVEKFILKCKPEYKVPGLYVIDSIVRQSRHQFGVEKDVFAPRFARNMKETFANLFRCAPEDKSRIIRVLNLWQKNNVFAPEVIQPLFDLADPNHPIYQMPPQPSANASTNDISSTSNGLNTSIGSVEMNTSAGNMSMTGSGTTSNTNANAVSQAIVDDKMVIPDLSIGHPKIQTNTGIDQNTIRQLQQIQQLLIRQTTSESVSTSTPTVNNQSETVKFNKKLIDYDYGDEEEQEKKTASPHIPNLLDNNNLKQLLKDPNVLRQLQTLQNFQKIKQEELRLQEEAFEKHIQSVLKASVAGEGGEIPNKGEVEFISEETKIEVINLDGNDSRTPTPDRDRYNKRRRSRSRSKSRSRDRGATRERRRRSRSRSRSRSRRRTSRERDRERERLSERNRDKEKEKEREHERERRRKGLPDMKKEHLSVCSTTLWVGHLSKLVYQEELSDTFGKYGEIVSIDQIVPRGCAFIVMHRRQDASKAMSALKNHKLQGRAITISWAAGKGVKSKEWKDFWDLELGVTYIPWSKLSDDTDVDALEEGGMFDEDTMPSWMKDKINSIKNVKDNTPANSNASGLLYPVDNMPKIDITQPPPQAAGMLPMPPFTMAPPLGGQPRLMPPMGVPMPGNLIPGLPVPPAMVPGMPPPHPMMMNPAMMPPPGYPPIPQLDKNIPPPNIRPDGQNLGNIPPSPFLGTPGLIPTLPLPTPQAFQQQPNANNATSDDQMDIEMEDEVQVNSGGGGAVLARNSPQPVPQVNFNQPPPAFQGGSGVSGVFPDGGMPHIPDSGNEDFSRDRNRGNNMRWGGADEREPNRDRPNDGGEIWNDGGNTIPTIGGGRNFDMNRRGGGGLPVNIPPFEINNHPQRPDFFDNRHGNGSDDYDRRGGPGRGNNGGPQDFFPNMQNRFNQPNNIMQMRIQPPPVFNNRMGGPGMGGPGMGGPSMGPLPGIFVRGQGPRPQETPTGGGFNFNDRPSFNRDMDNGNRMRGGRGMNMNDRRGGRGGGGRSGPNIWRDNDEEEDNGIFKRRMGGSSRFSGSRDRDNSHEDNRMNRDNRDSRSGNRRSMNDRGSRDQRDKRDSGDRRDNGDRREAAGDRDQPSRKTPEKEKPVPESSVPLDTEEDWDLELSEHQVETGPKIASPKRSKSIENDEEVWDDGVNSGQPQQQMEEEMSVPSSTPVDEEIKKPTEEPQNSLSTPLYDEPHQVSEARHASDKEPEDNADITSAADNISEEEAPVATEEVAEE